MKLKKHLSFTALLKMISGHVQTWSDPRRKNSTLHTIHDSVMSALACMYFQEPSLLQFQTEMEQKLHQNNLRTLFDVATLPSSNTIKLTLDDQHSQQFQPIYKEMVQRLQRGKQLQQFDLLLGLKICSIDGTQYHTSHSIHCQCCLTANKDNPDKPTRFYHSALQAAMMHPDVNQVIPIGVEPIKNSDGTKKQDCEINAAKRLIPNLHEQFPKMGLIITGDDLFSHQPMIETVLENNFEYLFVAKKPSHTFMMTWIETHAALNEIQSLDNEGRTVIYQWVNDVPLSARKDTVKVNFFCKKTITLDALGRQQHCRTESWITSIKITAKQIKLLVRGAKTRWIVKTNALIRSRTKVTT